MTYFRMGEPRPIVRWTIAARRTPGQDGRAGAGVDSLSRQGGLA